MSMEPAVDKDARTWGMVSHLAGLAAYSCIPFAGLVAVLVVWLVKREESAFVEDQGRESLNFQISVHIYYVIAGLLSFVFIGYLIMPFIFLFHVVFSIVAMIAANKGELYRYPLILRLVPAPRP